MDRINVLDHGFVALRNLAGPTRRTEQAFDASDVDPPNAARLSFDNLDSGRAPEADYQLAKYLMKNWHTSPFEMIEVWLEMKLPIFVARQFVRHRTVSLNEVSGRYVQLPAEWYIPLLRHVNLQSEDKKQGGRFANLSIKEEWTKASRYLIRLEKDCARSYAAYLESVADGIAMEQARCHLHLNHYTHWLWKQDLHNMMHFLSLRVYPHAQLEAQLYGNAIFRLLSTYLPKTMQLFQEYRTR